MNDKVLVTGATGFTGHNLAKKLLEEGSEVRVLVRSKKRLTLPDHPALDVRVGDIRDQASVDDAIKGVNRVFNIAAMFRSSKSVDQDYYDIHVQGVRYLVEASVKYGVSRFVHCSTVGVHGNIKEPPANEQSPYAPNDIYQRTKLEGELLAWDLAKQHGLKLSVIRPTAIYGPGDTRLLKLFKMANRNITPLLGDGKMFYHMVYIDDLVQGFLLASLREEAVGEAFIIGGDENMHLNDLLNTISGILGKPQKLIHLPVKPMKIAGTICEKICIPLHIEPPIYRRRVDFFTKSRSFDISKAKKLLGYQPKVGLKEGLTRTAQWYKAEGYL